MNLFSAYFGTSHTVTTAMSLFCRLLRLLALLWVFASPAALADAYYHTLTPDGIDASGGALPYPMSQSDGVRFCNWAYPWYSHDTFEVTPLNYSAPWVRVTCTHSSQPNSKRIVERGLLARCPTGTHSYANNGPGAADSVTQYTRWGYERDLGFNAFWCAAPCKKGETSIGGICQRDKNLGSSCPATQHPISIGLGNKFLLETDYVGSGPFPLAFRRYYNSRAVDMWQAAWSIDPWRHEYQRRVDGFKTQQSVAWFTVDRPDGPTSMFVESGSTIVSQDADSKDVLERLTDGGGTLTGWRFKSARTEETELFNAQGKLVSITNRAGATQTLAYSTAPTTGVPFSGLLTKVTDPFGRSLQFTYDSQSRIATMTDPSGGVYTYGYTYAGNARLITSVTYPDTRSKLYGYNEASLAMGGSYGLTSVVGEDGVLFATYEYAAQGRAVAETIGGIERTRLSYGPTGTTVTDALNTSRNYAFQNVLGTTRVTGQSQPGGAGCGPAAQGMGYDVNGNLTSRTDFNGRQTTYLYDLSRNLETSRTEAAGTPKARTITTQWHPTYRMPTQIDEPGKRTSYTHDAAGNVLTTTVLDTVAATSRTSTFTYNSYGQVLTADGPRTDVNDTTTFTYHHCTTGYQCGQVATVRNALNQTTQYLTYNAHGQSLTILDANNVLTTLTYDARQRLTSRDVGGEITGFEYWPTGLLKKVTLPDTTYLSYAYDAAHRLTGISDSESNSIVYTLDAMGNRMAENVYDPSSALSRTSYQVFDALSRLSQDFTASGSPTQATLFGYDANGNPTTVNAPLGRNSLSEYDELNRLKQVTDPNSGITQYGYNALDQLISVTDPRNLQTIYTYNALGDLKQQVSPDTGTTINTFDSGGNLKTSKDARNKTATYTYDAINRPSQVVYGDQTILYGYDAGTNGVGRLTSTSDSTNAASWLYDSLGRVTSKTQTVGTVVKTTGYGYTNGNLTSITTPYGAVIAYSYAHGRVTGITVNGASLLTNVLYEPFGPTNGWTWSNGTFAVRTYDMDGKLTQLDGAGLNTYGYDDAFRISGITDATTPDNSWTYGYDSLDRLNSASKTGFTQGFSYDADGNRLTQNGTTAATLTYPATNNKLTNVTGSLNKTYGYDAAGNTLSDGTIVYTYNNRGRMKTAKNGAASAVTYTYNALGQRVKKTGTTRIFVYGEAGHLQGEYNSSGTMVQEFVWLGDTPVAVLTPKTGGVNIFYIHTDHLNTPRKITRPSDNKLRWTWNPDAFGNGAPNTNPQALGTFTFNLRFPGQYFDAETGLHYNWHRYYDPQSGRYVSSDPIGLNGGNNTYAFVKGNPIRRADPSGLVTEPAPEYGWGPIAPWLIGTWVHSQFSEYVRGLGYQANNSALGLFNGKPDAYDSLNKLVWELKPMSCETNPGRALASAQLNQYISSAGHDWAAGDSRILFPNGYSIRSGTYYNGSTITITFYPDPLRPDSGLVFYKVDQVKGVLERLQDQSRQIAGDCGCSPLVGPRSRDNRYRAP